MSHNHFPTLDPPVKCQHCGEPFKQDGNHLVAFRASNGQLFCSEWCAEDAQEAYFQEQQKRRAMI